MADLADDAVRVLLEHAFDVTRKSIYLSVAANVLRSSDIEYPRGRLKSFLTDAPTFDAFFHMGSDGLREGVTLKREWRWTERAALAQHASVARAARQGELTAARDEARASRLAVAELERVRADSDTAVAAPELSLEAMRSLSLEELQRLMECGICSERVISTALTCGHVFCEACARSVSRCPNCRRAIAMRIRLFF